LKYFFQRQSIHRDSLHQKVEARKKAKQLNCISRQMASLQEHLDEDELLEELLGENGDKDLIEKILVKVYQ
jgi:hypothetical protein